MNKFTRWTICDLPPGAAAVLAGAAVCAAPVRPLHATAMAQAQRAARRPHPTRHRKRPVAGPPAAAQAPKLPPRIPFTAADEAAAVIPGMPDARFWADSTADFNRALPSQPGPWLILSTGGSDGAFGAGLLSGLSAAGNRPDYSVVTGVSTGALMAPFVFAGSRYDDALKAAYTQISAADIFEVGSTGESFVDSWPLKDLIAKADYAGAARRYRRRASTRPALVRCHHRSRCRALRGLEYGRHRRPWRRCSAQSVPQRVACLGQRSRRLSAGADRRRGRTANIFRKCTSTAASADNFSSHRPP